jgi:hypothetical protein
MKWGKYQIIAIHTRWMIKRGINFVSESIRHIAGQVGPDAVCGHGVVSTRLERNSTPGYKALDAGSGMPGRWQGGTVRRNGESVRTEPWSAAMAELKTAARSLGGKVSIGVEDCISMLLGNEQLEC